LGSTYVQFLAEYTRDSTLVSANDTTAIARAAVDSAMSFRARTGTRTPATPVAARWHADAGARTRRYDGERRATDGEQDARPPQVALEHHADEQRAAAQGQRDPIDPPGKHSRCEPAHALDQPLALDREPEQLG
jgi:hypothetical protein